MTDLETDGYVVLPDVLSAADVAAARREVEAALAGPDARRQGGTVHVDTLSGPVVDRLREALLPVVRGMLGPDAVLREAHFRGPLPGHGAQALHADYAGPPPSEPQVAVAVVALVDVAAEGGATRVVPGTHRWRRAAPSGDPQTRHPDEKRVPLPAGAALLFNGHLWHSGTRNDGPTRRDALQVTFVRPTAQAPLPTALTGADRR